MTEKLKETLRDSAPMRWLIMLLVSGITFGTYWFQDFYSGLKPLMETQLGITSTQFGTLISLTTIANVFGMIILGGIILDKWGIRLTGIVFGVSAAIGGLLNALGSAGVFGEEPTTRLTVMIIGRIFFGVGLEVSCVVVLRTIVKWFRGYELALAMALNMGFGRLGSTIGTALSPDIANQQVPAAVSFAATLIGIGLVMFIIYIIFDVKLDKQMGETAGERGSPSRSGRDDSGGVSEPTAPPRARTHKIVDGDTLQEIARRYLGSASLAGAIFESNRVKLSDPALLPIGMELTIPPENSLSVTPTDTPIRQPLVPVAEQPR